MSLVGLVDHESLAVQLIGRKILPTEFRDEPVNDAETDLCGTDQIRHDLCDIGIRRIESLERRNDQLGLTVDLLATGLGIGTVGFHLEVRIG